MFVPPPFQVMFPNFVNSIACGHYHGQVCQSVVEFGNVPTNLTAKIINWLQQMTQLTS